MACLRYCTKRNVTPTRCKKRNGDVHSGVELQRPPLTGAERMRICRKRKRELRLCIVMGCKRKSGDESRCKPCEAEHAAWMRTWRAGKAA